MDTAPLGWQHPTGKIPRRVAILAAGPSKSDYVNMCSSLGVEGGFPDEVWSLNTVARAVRSDVVFIMDDYLDFVGHHPQFAHWMETCTLPIITSKPYKSCPTAFAYPLGEVLNLPGARPFLNSTVPYMIAYAILIGVKDLAVYGADYVRNDAPYNSGFEAQHGAARFMGCASFWLGMAAGRGMSVAIAPSSPLLDGDTSLDQWFYGYKIKPVMRFHSGDDGPPALTQLRRVGMG